MIIPNIWENKNVPNHQPELVPPKSPVVCSLFVVTAEFLNVPLEGMHRPRLLGKQNNKEAARLHSFQT